MSASNWSRGSARGDDPSRRGRFVAVLAAFLAFTAASGDIRAEEDGDSADQTRKLTVEDAVEQSVERAEYVELQEATIEESEAARRGATRVPNPAFLYDREQWWQEGDVFSQDWFLLEQSLELPGVRTARRDAADAEVEASHRERNRNERELRFEIRRTFYELLALRRRIDRTEAWLERLREARERVETRVESGEFSDRAVAGLTADYETARAELESLRSERDGRLRAFLSRVGVESGEATWRLEGTLKRAKVEMTEQSAVDRLEARSDLRALEAEARSAAAEARRARRSWISSIGVHGGYIRISEPGLVAHGFAAGIGIPLPIFDRNRAEAGEEAARKRRIQSRLTLQRRELAARVRGMVRSAKRRRKAAVRFRKRGVETVRDLVEQSKSAYRADEASLFDVLDAERRLFEAEQKLIDLRERATLAELELAAEVGPPPEQKK